MSQTRRVSHWRCETSSESLPKLPFHEFVLRRAEGREAIPAFIDPDTHRTVTYGQFARDVPRIAAGLALHGMRKADVFAVMLPNVPEFTTAFCRVLASGGIVTPLNPFYAAEEIAHQLQDSGAKYLLTILQGVERTPAAAVSGRLRKVFVVGTVSD